jgi:hypothetical protein
VTYDISTGTSVSSKYKNNCHDITEILLKMELSNSTPHSAIKTLLNLNTNGGEGYSTVKYAGFGWM